MPQNPKKTQSTDAASQFLQGLVQNGQAQVVEPTTPSNDTGVAGSGMNTQQPKGTLAKTWENINTPVGDLAFGQGATKRVMSGGRDFKQEQNAEEMNMLSKAAHGEDITIGDRARHFLFGAGDSAEDTAQSFTSPLGLAMMAAGGVGRAGKSLQTLGKVGVQEAMPYLARVAPNVVNKLAPAANAITKAAGAGFGLHGAYDALFGGEEGESLPDKTGRVLTDLSNVSAGGAGVREAGPGGEPLRGRFGKRVIPDSGGMTRGEVYQFARDRGVPMNLAQAGEGKVARSMEMFAEEVPGGAGRMQKDRQGAEQKLGEAVTGLQDKFDPLSKGKDIAAQASTMQKVAGAAKEVARDNATQKYADIDPLFKEERVDLRAVKDMAKKEIRSLFRGNVSSVKPTSSVQILKEIANGPDTASFGNAHVDRSNLMSARFSDAMIPGKAEAALRRIGQAYNEAMKDSATKAEAEGYKGVLSKFEDAQKTWKEYHENFGDRSSPLARMIDEKEPGKVLDHLLSNTNKGSIRAMRQITEFAPEFKGLVKREFLRRLFDRTGNEVTQDFGLMQKRLSQGYSAPFLRELFNPDELKDVQKIARVGQSLNMETNPSGTSRKAFGMASYGGMLAGGFDLAAGAASGDASRVAKGLAMTGGLPLASNVASRALESQKLTDYLMGYEKPEQGAATASKARPGVIGKSASTPSSKTIANPFASTVEKKRKRK